MTPLEEMFIGKTFDDFLLPPQHSFVTSRHLAEVEVSMPLTRQLNLNLPIVAANMDTVTGQDMAKAMALEGGFAFIHRNCSVGEQVRMIEHVKRQYAYVIAHPLILPQETPVSVATKRMDKNGISCVLVSPKQGSQQLAGIFSHRDVPPENSEEPIGKFMTPLAKLIYRLPGISLEEAEQVMFKARIEKLPLIDGQGKIKGLITMRDLKLSKKKPHSAKDNRGRLLIGGTIGTKSGYMDQANELINAGADCILIDIAHADSEVMTQAISVFRLKWRDFPLVAGNVATRSGTELLMSLGVDAIKVGIGPGRGCRTRLETGFGVPQLQAIREAYCATEGKIPIIADGGIKNDKDIFMAVAAGASTVMLGSMLSGTTESPGTVMVDPVTQQKEKWYRGMTSPEARLDGAQVDPSEALSTPAEGQSVKVPYVGSVTGILDRIRGHLKSSVSYAGVKTLQQAHQKIASRPKDFFVLLSESSKRESYDR